MKQDSRKLWFAAGAIGLAGAVVATRRMRSVQQRPSTLGRQGPTDLPRASVFETIAAVLEVFVPTIAKGVIVRRPRVEAMAEQIGLDRRAIRRLQKLRSRHGTGPLMLRLPIRNQAVLLDPRHVQRVLAETPDPFAPDSSEKRAALVHLEPRGALISHRPQRSERRQLNEQALGHEKPVHPLAQTFLNKLDEEAARILDHAHRGGELTWEEFTSGWGRLVRRVVFGDAAAEDRTISEMTFELRQAANWAFMRPPKAVLRARFLERIRNYLDLAEPGSLAAVVASLPKSAGSAPEEQVPQWLFAFDPAGMATFRALALLATHPEQLACAREEIRAHPGDERQTLPFLRATLLESLRLWPTTPLLLRQTTRETEWEHGRMPAGTGVAIFAPFFHRDATRMPDADSFNPQRWLDGDGETQDALVPFSAGPGICPGRHLVLLLGSAMLATLLDDRSIRLEEARRLVPGSLPATLDHYSLRFALDS